MRHVITYKMITAPNQVLLALTLNYKSLLILHLGLLIWMFLTYLHHSLILPMASQAL